MTGRPVYVNWDLSSYTGWGVYGLNLALQWCQDPDLTVYFTGKSSREGLSLDLLRQLAIEPLLRRSEAFQAKLAPLSGQAAAVQGLALNGFDDAFEVAQVAHDVRLLGEPSLAVTFFETTQMAPDALLRAAQYPLVVAGSSWNAEILRAHGLKDVRFVMQGVDPAFFHPAPRQGLYPDRFLVFSGGKLERRKGQDLVLAAFRRFAERRTDALLVTAWQSPFNGYAPSLNLSGLASPLPPGGESVDVLAWAAANGIDRDHVIDLGMIANRNMPGILREMDVALFPNRAEGGTNLVAMECLACGVPAILSCNTGHLDLIEDGNCYPLDQQGVLAGREGPFGAVAGWGESDVDEIVEQLERVYAHREEARARGLAGAAMMTGHSWAGTAQAMKAIILSH